MVKPYYSDPYGLIKSTVIVCGLVAVSIIGALGLIGLGLEPSFTELTKANNLTVLAAAPFKITRIGVEMRALTSLYAPPEYSKVTLLKTQSLQFIPSSCWIRFENVDEEKFILNGGTTGFAGSLTITLVDGGDCANNDIWFPNKDITRTPDINDPNANVILDITPPFGHEKGNGVKMHFHYGWPPDLEERAKPENDNTQGS